jgi:hypothetical protein
MIESAEFPNASREVGLFVELCVARPLRLAAADEAVAGLRFRIH